MTREELQANVKSMRATAGAIVRRHAMLYAPAVPEDQVEAIVAALGDLSLDEALDALTWQQRQAHGMVWSQGLDGLAGQQGRIPE